MGAPADRYAEPTLPEWIGDEMTLDDLTTRLLLFVLDYHARHGRGPTYQLMARRFSRSTSTIQLRLRVLHRQGLVDWVHQGRGTLHPTAKLVAHFR